ncbi:MAG: malto-oligosyltrehalose synthase, partial [Betaproteobacteria bacterium]
QYSEHRFPLEPRTYVLILEHRLAELQASLPEGHADIAELLSIITALKHLPTPTETDTAKIEERYREKEVIKRRLSTLTSASPEVRAHIEENVRLFNGTKGDPESFDLLDGLMNQQIYRLSHWRVATEEINYRRFFDVNGLGAIRMEHHGVFQAAHQLIFRLIRDKSVTGLRIDHPDGLYNPVEYFHRLQRGCFTQQLIASEWAGDPELLTPQMERALAERYDEAVLADPAYKPFYIVGEKILTKSERMPEDWPIFSTTGYVFLNSVNGIFIDGSNTKVFDGIYEKFTRAKVNFLDIMYDKKRLVMEVAMSSEVNTLGHYLNDLSEKSRHTRDFTLNSLRRVIVEVIAALSVYRTYTNTWQASDRDVQYIEHAVSRAKRKNPAMSGSIFDFLKEVLTLRFPKDFQDEDKSAWLDFVMRFQQITGPVMAKGVEDTAFYVYNRLVSLNEVGGMPDRFGTSLETFHGQNIERLKNWPHALITTATHDTKRSEDVRARINVLSEMPREWADRARSWARMNRRKKTVIDGVEAPDRNEEYLLYQTLVGAWPIEPMEGNVNADFIQRIKDYMLKASREAKVNTSWINPDHEYEGALLTFIDDILRPAGLFLNDFRPFQQTISRYGLYNSLSQTLLKICAPGVPDFYQGSEWYDFSLVDPDNRRPVDYEKRGAMLAELKRKEAAMTRADLARELSRKMDDGLIKQYLISKSLNYRKSNRAMFEQGEYLPLNAAGEKADHVCAFARRLGSASIIVAVPRFLTRLIPVNDRMALGEAPWEGTHLVLPDAEWETRYRNIFTDEIVAAEPQQEGKQGLALTSIFASFPLALMEKQA